ncbi:EutN/CcmL family microcompartment protein [Candidatus Riflebacteria bacterium]
MYLGKVTGRIVPNFKHPKLDGYKLLWVQPIDAFGCDNGASLIAIDTVGAGNGEKVFLVSAMEASFAALPTELVPADAAIVGIVDSVFTREQKVNPIEQKVKPLKDI